MPTFLPNIINNTIPAIEVVEEGGTITYNQIKESLGTYVYNVKELYLYSENINQLIGVINYNSYDADGNRNITNISTIFDPYQIATSIYVDLRNYPLDVILNGNSSVSTNILANTMLQIKFMSKRITSSFGANLNNFLVGERLAGKPNFFDNYGDLKQIKDTNLQVEKTATLKNFNGDGGVANTTNKEEENKLEDAKPKILMGLLAGSVLAYLFFKRK
jgi:hypothetical protein